MPRPGDADGSGGLELYQRGRTWWVRGRLEGEDRYYRESLGTSVEAVARAKVRDLKAEALKRAVLGKDAPKPEERLTFAEAVLLSEPKPRDAGYLARIIPHLGSKLVREITPQTIKRLARKLYPEASVDTWHRQVVVPVRSVINGAHDEGLCPPIRVKAFTNNERMAQDRARGKDSRVPKRAGSWEWLLAFRQEADPRVGAMAFFMFTTGARISQTLAMERKRDLDLFNLRVRMPAAKGHPAQWVEILPEVAVAIEALPEPTGEIAKKRVFRYGGGRSGWLYLEWKRACLAAGIAYLSPHQAGRHGFGTEMIVRMKMDPSTAAREGRWSSPTVLLDTYSHAEEGSVSVRQAFQDGLNAARTNTVQGKIKNRGKAAGSKGFRSV